MHWAKIYPVNNVIPHLTKQLGPDHDILEEVF